MRPEEPAFLVGGRCANMANNRQYKNAANTVSDAQKATVCQFSPTTIFDCLTLGRGTHLCLATPVDCGRCNEICKESRLPRGSVKNCSRLRANAKSLDSICNDLVICLPFGSETCKQSS